MVVAMKRGKGKEKTEPRKDAAVPPPGMEGAVFCPKDFCEFRRRYAVAGV